MILNPTDLSEEDRELDEAMDALSRIGEPEQLHMLEFFAYETVGAAVYNPSSMVRVDFQ